MEDEQDSITQDSASAVVEPTQDLPVAHPLERLSGGKIGVALVALLLLLNGTLATTSALRKSVTVDEFAWLPNGMAILRTGSFHIQADTPPLGKVLPALAVAGFTSAKFDGQTAQELKSAWACGHQFIAQNPDDFHGYFMVGRGPSIVILSLTCLFSYLLAARLYGRSGGLLTAACVCLSPNLIAHGRLATNDIHLTFGVVLVVFAVDMLLKRPRWQAALLLGLGLALALLSKFTGVVVFLLTPIVIAVCLLLAKFAQQTSEHRSDDAPEPDATWGSASRAVLMQTLVACCFAILLVNLAYGFQGSLTTLGAFEFQSSGMQKLQASLPGWLPMPLPSEYVLGPDKQLMDSGYESYLMGRFRNSGFWSYYVVAFLVKTPLGLLAFGAVATLAGGRPRLRETPLLAFGVFLFVFFTVAGHKNIGLRYLLMMIPLGCVFLGRFVNSSLWTESERSRRVAVLTTSVLWLGLLFATVSQWPHYLPFFNIVSGGPSNGRLWLLDSNIDWGQDLLLLREFMEKHQIDEVDLAYFGRVRPEHYDINFHHLVTQSKNRYAVISANLLWGRRYYVNGTAYWIEDRDHYASYRQGRPVAVLGHTLYVFDQGEPQ